VEWGSDGMGVAGQVQGRVHRATASDAAAAEGEHEICARVDRRELVTLLILLLLPVSLRARLIVPFASTSLALTLALLVLLLLLRLMMSQRMWAIGPAITAFPHQVSGYQVVAA